MAVVSETYVDPSIAGNSGTGTIGDPYGDVQYALNTMTRDAANGDRLNVKAGTAEILAGTLSLASYGSPGSSVPLNIEGYTAVAGDGGTGELDGNNGNFSILANTAYVTFRKMKLGNTGSANVYSGQASNVFIECELHTSTASGLVSVGMALSCNFHDLSVYGANGVTTVADCYFKNGASKKFTAAIRGTSGITRNIISIDGASVGILVSSHYQAIDSNSVFSNAGTGKGIDIGAVVSKSVTSNLVEGFSGAGGTGFDVSPGGQRAWLIANNSAYNNTTNFDSSTWLWYEGNEALGSSPFDKSGSDTFANRLVYFAPADVGSVRGGTFGNSTLDRGAVQSSGGGAAGMLRRSNMRGGF